MQIITTIDGLWMERSNGVKEKYHLIATNEALYLIHASTDYRSLVENLFSGAGDIAGLFGDVTGVVGGLVAGLAGDRVGKLLDQLSKSRSDKRMEKVLRNLEDYARKGKGVEKVGLAGLEQVICKKGYRINGKSKIELRSKEKTHRLLVKKRAGVDALIDFFQTQAPAVSLDKRWW